MHTTILLLLQYTSKNITQTVSVLMMLLKHFIFVTGSAKTNFAPTIKIPFLHEIALEGYNV